MSKMKREKQLYRTREKPFNSPYLTVRHICFLLLEAAGGLPHTLRGGISGLRDEALLESAAAAPFAAFGGVDIYPSLFQNAARLGCGLGESVIVVECGLKGGTWHAINGGLKLNKPLGCFAYKPEHYSEFSDSLGNKKLLESGKAVTLHDEATIGKFIERTGAVQNVLF